MFLNKWKTARVGLILLAMIAFCSWRAEAREGGDATDSSVTAEKILQQTEVEGGMVVHLHCGDGRLTEKLCRGDRCHVQGLDTDAEKVQAARNRLQKKGRYGTVTIEHFRGTSLPYTDSLVNVLVAEQLGDVPLSEVMRVLAPGGVACIKRDGKWTKTVKPRPADIDDWTHYLHDASGNAVAADERVGHPRRLRWKSGPQWSRNHEFNPSINALVSAGGRMFYLHDEGMLGLTDLRFPSRWSLVARDAFNGTLLWKRPLPNWGYREWNTVGMWSAPLTLNRRVVTDGKRVFVTLGYKAPVTVLDAATGEDIRTISDTRGTDEMLLIDGTLVLCVREKLSVAVPPKKKPNRRRNPHEYSIQAPGPAELVGIARRAHRLDAGFVTSSAPTRSGSAKSLTRTIVSRWSP
ncbi:MAG: class I SAM-dependent methyltransferase [bacterium]